MKKLYEGVPFEVTRHWNKHAVNKPKRIDKGIDIGSKSKKLTVAFFRFGEYLAYHLSAILEEDITPEKITNINEYTYSKGYWWDQERIKPITYHISPSFNEKDFFIRCKMLSQLLVEPLPENIFRETLQKLDVYTTLLADYKSLYLLNELLKYFFFSNKTGCNLYNKDDVKIMKKRIGEELPSNPIKPLILLQEFRNIDSHPISKSDKIKIITESNEIFNFKDDFKRKKYEFALEKIYDKMINTFEENIDVLKQQAI